MSLPQIGAKLVLDGEQDFKKALTGINAEMKAMESGLKLVEMQYKDNAASTEAIAAKTAILNQMMDAQKEKVKTLQDALANANTALATSKAKHEENATALTASKTKYEAAEAEVKNYEQELEKLQNKLSTSASATGIAAMQALLYKKDIEQLTAELQKSKLALKDAETDVNKLQATMQASSNGVLSAQNNISRWTTSLNNAQIGVLELHSRLDSAADGVADFNAGMKTMESELKLVERQYKNNANSTAAIAAKTAILNQMMDAQKERVHTLREAYLKANAALTEHQKQHEKNEAALTASKTKYEAAEAEVKNYEQELEKLNTQYAALTPETDETGVQTVKLMLDIAKMTEALEKSKAALSATETEVNSLQVAMSASQDDVHSAQNEVHRWQTSLTGAAVDLRELQTRLDTVSNNGVADFNNGMNRMQQETAQTTSHIHSLADGVAEARSKFVGLNSVFAGTLGARVAGDALMYLGQKILEVTKNGIELSSDLTEVHNVIDNVFTGMNDSLYAWAEKSAASFGISMLNAEKYAGQLGAMFSASGMTEQATYDLSTALVKMTGDMASFYNYDTSEMFEKIQAGLTGQVKPLRELGIDMTVANLNAYALATGLSKTYDEMSQAEKYQLRYNYLVQQASIAQDDFTETVNTFANQQRLAELNVADLSAKIGEALTPALNTGLKAFNEWATNGEATAGIMANLGDIAETVVNVLVKSSTFLLDHLEGVTYALATIGAAKGMFTFGKGISVVVEATKALKAGIVAATAAQEALTAAEIASGIAAAANPIGLVMAGVAVAVIGAVAAFDALTDSQRELDAAAEASKKAFIDAKAAVEETTKKIETNKETLKELQAQWDAGFHTDALKEQLGTLKENTAELEAQLELQRLAAEAAREQAELDAMDVLNSTDGAGSFNEMQKAIDAYKDGLANITELEAQRDAKLKAAADARANENEYRAQAEEDNAERLELQIEEANKQQQTYKSSMLETATAMNTQAESITGTTEASAEMTKQVDDYTTAVNNLGNEWSYVPTDVTTTYKIKSVKYGENIVQGAMSLGMDYGPYDYGEKWKENRLAAEVTQSALSLGTEYGQFDYGVKRKEAEVEPYEAALQTELEALDHNLALKKVSEEEYWSQKQALLDKNKNTESELYFEQQDEITAHYDKLNADAVAAAQKAAADAQKTAADNERATKEAATAATNAAKQAYDELEKQYERGEVDRKTFNRKYADLVKSWGSTQKDVALDTAKKVEKINEDAAKEAYDELEKQYDEGLIDRKTFNSKYAALVKSWGNTQKDVAYDTAKNVEKINEDKAKEEFKALKEKYDEGLIDRKTFNEEYVALVKSWGNACVEAEKEAQKAITEIDKKEQEDRLKNVESSTASALAVYEKQYEDIQGKIESFKQSIGKDFSSLFSIAKNEVAGNTYTYANFGVDADGDTIGATMRIQQEMNRLKVYKAQLAELKNRGASDELMEQFQSLSLEEGSVLANTFSLYSDYELKSAGDAWKEYQKELDTVASEPYESQITAAQEALYKKLSAVLGSEDFKGVTVEGGKALIDQMIKGVKEESKVLGTDLTTELTKKLGESKKSLDEAENSPKSLGLYMAQGIADGIASGTGLITKVLNNTSDEMLKTIKKKFGIKSPSRVFRDEVGVHLAAGLGEGFEQQMQIVKSQMADSLNAADILNGVSRTALKAPAALAMASTTQTQSTNFTQNNYSPKALTQYEIKKNTQALFQLNTLK